MSVLSGQSIRDLCDGWRADPLITPFVERTVKGGMSGGLSVAGYDIHLKLPEDCRHHLHDGKESWCVMHPGDFLLASSVERIIMPDDLICIVHDKSSWARKGLAIQNTVLEPGWQGWITMELTYHGNDYGLRVYDGVPIAQLIFHKLDKPAENPYSGKYQNQDNRAVSAIDEF